MPFCRHCGSEYHEPITFCRSCGERIGSATPLPSSEAPSVDSRSPAPPAKTPDYHSKRMTPVQVGAAVMTVAVLIGYGLIRLRDELRDKPSSSASPTQPATPANSAAPTSIAPIASDADLHVGGVLAPSYDIKSLRIAHRGDPIQSCTLEVVFHGIVLAPKAKALLDNDLDHQKTLKELHERGGLAEQYMEAMSAPQVTYALYSDAAGNTELEEGEVTVPDLQSGQSGEMYFTSTRLRDTKRVNLTIGNQMLEVQVLGAALKEQTERDKAEEAKAEAASEKMVRGRITEIGPPSNGFVVFTVHPENGDLDVNLVASIESVQPEQEEQGDAKAEGDGLGMLTALKESRQPLDAFFKPCGTKLCFSYFEFYAAEEAVKKEQP